MGTTLEGAPLTSAPLELNTTKGKITPNMDQQERKKGK